MEHPGSGLAFQSERDTSDNIAGGKFTSPRCGDRGKSGSRASTRQHAHSCLYEFIPPHFSYTEELLVRKKKTRTKLLVSAFPFFSSFSWECFLSLPGKSSEGQSFLSTSEDMLYWTLSEWRILLLFAPLWDGLCASGVKPTRWPLYSQKPLLLAWNIPTQECGPWHKVSLELDQFQIVASPNEGFVRQNLTMFYKDRLGFYPYFEQDETPIHGGLPQVASLSQHLEKMRQSVAKYIPDQQAVGLAVIDWEEWRPVWIRNWGPKYIYRSRSVELVRQKNPTWPAEQLTKVAQQEYEMSAKNFMLGTLKNAKHLRPHQLWGFYLFPDCYNHNYLQSLVSYTGRCPDPEESRNEQLKWLWNESTALFPSVYMGTVLRSSASGCQFVRNRVKEGMRLASSGDGLARPVFVYTRPTYTDSLQQLTETDLVSTIGESVALGAAGIILWGDAAYNKTTCSDLDVYLRGTLGQYLLNVSTAAELCSQTLCGSHGRCLRKNPDSDAYLHLSPLTHSFQRPNGKLTVSGELGEEDEARFRADFQCQCYSGFLGEDCGEKDPQHQTGTAARAGTSALQCVALLLTFVLLSFT